MDDEPTVPGRGLGLTQKGLFVLRLCDFGVAIEDAGSIAEEFDPVFRVYEEQRSHGDQRTAIMDTFDALSCSLRFQDGEIDGAEFSKAIPVATPASWTFLVDLMGQLLKIYCSDAGDDPHAYLEEQRQNYYRMLDKNPPA